MEFHRYVHLFRVMNDEEFPALKESIAQHGLREPIAVWHGEIADGRNRYNACAELGIQPRYEDVSHMTEEELFYYVIDKNSNKRHLDKTDRLVSSTKILAEQKRINEVKQIEAGKQGEKGAEYGKEGGRGNKKENETNENPLVPELAQGGLENKPKKKSKKRDNTSVETVAQKLNLSKTMVQMFDTLKEKHPKWTQRIDEALLKRRVNLNNLYEAHKHDEWGITLSYLLDLAIAGNGKANGKQLLERAKKQANKKIMIEKDKQVAEMVSQSSMITRHALEQGVITPRFIRTTFTHNGKVEIDLCETIAGIALDTGYIDQSALYEYYRRTEQWDYLPEDELPEEVLQERQKERAIQVKEDNELVQQIVEDVLLEMMKSLGVTPEFSMRNLDLGQPKEIKQVVAVSLAIENQVASFFKSAIDFDTIQQPFAHSIAERLQKGVNDLLPIIEQLKQIGDSNV